MRISSDDELFRTNLVWLGPQGLTLPFAARYLAYATWLGFFLLILLVEGVTPLSVHLPPVWEICIATIATYGLLVFVDHERPVGSIWSSFIADLTAPRRTKPKSITYQDRHTTWLWVQGRLRKVIR